MLEKSGVVDGIHIEWHTLEHMGENVTACFSDPDDPMWEFWCGDRKVSVFGADTDGAYTLCLFSAGKPPSMFDAVEQRDAVNAFHWLVS